jgi:Short C-terminal domain
MPGLLRGIARTAVIAGTATAVSNRVSRRQLNRWSQQEEQQPPPQQYQQPPPQQYQQPPPQYYQPPPPQYYQPPPAAAPPRDTVTQLKELAELKSQGILTDAEFQAQKAKILG